MKLLRLTTSMALVLSASLQAADWGYQGEHAPEHWGQVSQICEEGKNQSPIDVTQAIKSELAPLNIHYQGVISGLTNNGHTLQASVSGENQWLLDGVTFTLRQFHFHTPSENRLQGQQYPLEAHFVHTDEAGNIAVLAVMFERGEANAALSQLLVKLPNVGESMELSNGFDVQSLLPSLGQFYRFNGSLTTPPCSEGVRWLVLKQPKTLSVEQASALHAMMGNNNRPLQPHNARLILSQE
ncbi:carbonic anhydrase [Vibrio cincinnatiensis]|uniref:carbonic anhydrase n=1 Tax=Vibrio cincinnatiensis TaxID=675 RepID=UPI001EE11311|nr:carbonic anhydrase family protein [Vibrio cincinnatiensis]MCG3724322.1 carbonic anhydrase [Vibrio cincinnatiensis]MCG3764907.1 carbonic anhydrase [Vibrio cincinnatiensis]